MKIVITGGGTGGHFYPLIAVADQIKEQAENRKLLRPDIYYVADKPYNKELLLRKDITFKKINAGKLRIYFSFQNVIDVFTSFFGTIKTLFVMFSLYPDVVFTNGSYVAMPVLVSARILGIPVVIHTSDTVPGRALLYAGRFARRISIAFPEAIEHYREKDRSKVALLGNPVRKELMRPLKSGAHEFLELDPTMPTILIIGGSSGAQAMNDAIIDALPTLLLTYNIIHQCGNDNKDDVFGRSEVVLYDHPYKNRYKLYPYLDELATRMSVGAASLMIIRAGAGTISEAALWGKPSITIPIPTHVSRDQESNAFAYARSGATVVIKQQNLSAGIIISEINRILSSEEVMREMSTRAKEFSRPGAADSIANAVLDIALEHEK